MQNKTNPRNSYGNVDWGAEIANAFAIAGRVIGKFFAYLLNVLLTVLLVCLITGIIVAGAFAIYVKNYIDPAVDLSLFKTGQNATTQIYYMDYTDRVARIGTPVELDSQSLFGSKNSIWVSYSDMPENLYNAFVSIEDKRFWTHKGVDWLRTANVAVQFFISNGTQGASTITQQLIKNITQEDEVTIQRKVQEILRALNLEKQKSKEEILEMYLNIIYLSENCYGVQAAAKTYFNKEVSDLTLIECAALAAIPQFPSRYDPYLYPENNKVRRDAVLEQMLENGCITKEEFDGAYGKELTLDMQRSSNDTTSSINSWYVDAVIEDVVDALVEEKGYPVSVARKLVWTGGYKIYILMDPDVQETLEEIYENDENFLRVSDGVQPQSAMVVIDPYTGDVLGLVGGRGEKTQNSPLNRATQSVRPPGSAIKPLSVYAPSLDLGLITYGSVFDDVPVNFGNYTDLSSTTYDAATYVAPKAWPQNLPAVYNGLTTVNSAIERSVNTVAVRVLQKLTVDRSFSFMKDKLHMFSLIESYTNEAGVVMSDKQIAPLALGQLTWGITVREITAGYAIFQNNGVWNKPRTFWKVTDSEDNIILLNESESEIVIQDTTASIMTKMLQNVMINGTGRAVTLRNTVDVAGKTGTTNADYDRWFVGYTPYYVGGVWFGYDMPLTLNDFKQNPAALVWDTVMTKLHQKYIDEAAAGGEPLKKFELAPGVVTATYCKDSGLLLSDACLADPRGSRAETGYFTRTTVPTTKCQTHVLVEYDTATGGVTGAVFGADDCTTCDPKYVKKVGLIKVEDRSFPIEVTVTDAQYVYRPVSRAIIPSSWYGVPYFQNTLKAGTYCGASAVGGGRVFNSFCYEHFNFDKYKNPSAYTETTEPDTTAPDVEEPKGQNGNGNGNGKGNGNGNGNGNGGDASHTETEESTALPDTDIIDEEDIDEILDRIFGGG